MITEIEPKASLIKTVDTKIAAHAEVLRILEEIKDKKTSPEIAWKFFWLKSSPKFGGYAKTVQIISDSGYTDQEIFGFLRSANYPEKQIVRILESAGWSHERISNMVMIFFLDNCQIKEVYDEIFGFFMFCGWDDVDFVKALIITDCFTSKAIRILLQCKWEKNRIAEAVIKSQSINKFILRLLIPVPGLVSSKNSPLLTIEEFFNLLKKNGFTKEKVVALFAGIFGKAMDCIRILEKLNFKLDFICLKLLNFGYSVSEIINPIYKAWIVNYSSDDLNQIEILVRRGQIVKLMKKMKLTNQIIFRELHDMEWTFLMIIESMVMAQISKKKIIQAFFETEFNFLSADGLGRQIRLCQTSNRLSDFFIIEAINQGRVGFNSGQNFYWDDTMVRSWKSLVCDFVASKS